MKVGDVVILKDDNIKRIFWKLAKVIELLSGSDGVARAAFINVSDESGPPKVLKRSIRHLIPIEVNDEDVGHGEQSSATGDCHAASGPPPQLVRPDHPWQIWLP